MVSNLIFPHRVSERFKYGRLDPGKISKTSFSTLTLTHGAGLALAATKIHTL